MPRQKPTFTFEWLLDQQALLLGSKPALAIAAPAPAPTYWVVHPFGVWKFADYDQALTFCYEDGLGAFDLSVIGVLQSRATLVHGEG